MCTGPKPTADTAITDASITAAEEATEAMHDTSGEEKPGITTTDGAGVGSKKRKRNDTSTRRASQRRARLTKDVIREVKDEEANGDGSEVDKAATSKHSKLGSWTPEQDAVLQELNRAGYGNTEIVQQLKERLGLSKTVSAVRQRLGKLKDAGVDWSDAQVSTLREVISEFAKMKKEKIIAEMFRTKMKDDGKLFTVQAIELKIKSLGIKNPGVDC